MGFVVHKRLNIPLITVRAIIKMFQTSGTVANLPGRGCNYMLSPHTVRKMVREAKKNPRTADFSCVFGSQSLKINHKMPPPYQQAVWKVCKTSLEL